MLLCSGCVNPARYPNNVIRRISQENGLIDQAIISIEKDSSFATKADKQLQKSYINIAKSVKLYNERIKKTD